MNTVFKGLPIVDILQVGLSGLCFLLSVLSFQLIYREQHREANPRKGILHSIYVFMGTNFLVAILVAVSPYFVLTPTQSRKVPVDVATPDDPVKVSGNYIYFPRTIRDIQKVLKAEGHYSGDIDGVLGPSTIEAVTRYQSSNGIPADGTIGIETLQTIFSHSPENLPDEQKH
ncbi:peptidoglycan-binding domain-containing protein [Methylovulum miyakonense]|uniref:peptidoglycan-binding domain-containing protein n=1 Tax=Methylovulum miyakonense TaxID=645578 RepID=UPI0012EC5FBA|nr:peptidoglycan-binding domain-containing protein [Methylovulum miyakonense]